ncbi:glycoside hydrolase family 18 protein [Dyadobacter fanqingshengii]|uniref:chitinase n=1 Tax=Dyadobacter fanqingshengii TaxID=2906443 RepID=A0A9X1PF85_9BACT|nr:glycoside hydrolase family 18 protein [Dyadobacter fanqingshengii]MCF0043019.1 glycoside hydrolase family 18 protein [Dyadobacter fanqingshengii]USJ35573.1 glycoside hydrolase family 18 protein [Dyadobacter fanqingshengii]
MLFLKFTKTLLPSLAAMLVLSPLLLTTACKSEEKKEETATADSSATKPVVIGYVGGFRGLVNTDRIEVEKLTHINYAFVDVQKGKAFLTNEKTDSTNFRNLKLLKEKNPDLKILISLGGWTWSENFSDAVLTEASRKVFAASSVDIIKKYDLDGVDIDWEYPGMPGEDGNVYRPEDKQNFTLMFEAIRKELDVFEKESGKKKLLTTAVPGFTSFLKVVEMGKAAAYLDYVNMMTYDLFQGDTAVHHAALYNSDIYKASHSVDNAVKAFSAEGVPMNKLVVGLPFYGRMFRVAKLDKGLGQKQISQKYVDGYTMIKDSMVNKNGFKEYRDEVAKAPYLLNAKTGDVLSYDDEQSVREKCKYVLDKKLAGVMFWEYDSDSKTYLLDEIDKTFK